jgi:superfamily II DNA or RNA helicase
VLDRLGVGYATLTGRMPAADRKDPIARFRDDPGCRVFLSTDAGGSGLNLQAADTVVHLEVPWNPAVLEQRTARVHRMGQSRPVRVIRLVTRGSVEERVLDVIAQKRSLFTGLFEGDSDAVDFAAPGQGTFLEALRGALDLAAEQPATPAAPDRLVRAGVALLEALAEVMGGRPADPELAERGRRALAALDRAFADADRLDGDAGEP